MKRGTKVGLLATVGFGLLVLAGTVVVRRWDRARHESAAGDELVLKAYCQGLSIGTRWAVEDSVRRGFTVHRAGSEGEYLVTGGEGFNRCVVRTTDEGSISSTEYFPD